MNIYDQKIIAERRGRSVGLLYAVEMIRDTAERVKGGEVAGTLQAFNTLAAELESLAKG